VATNNDPRIDQLRRLTGRRTRVGDEWQAKIRECHAAGIPLRQIGKAAGVSHVRVLQIVRGP
jgi:transposase-like protein